MLFLVFSKDWIFLKTKMLLSGQLPCLVPTRQLGQTAVVTDRTGPAKPLWAWTRAVPSAPHFLVQVTAPPSAPACLEAHGDTSMAPPTLAVLCPPWGGPAPSAHCRSESLHSSLLQPFPSMLLSHPTSPPETAGSHLSAITPWGHRTGGPRTPAGIRTPRVTGPSPGLPVLWVWGGARDSAFLSCP